MVQYSLNKNKEEFYLIFPLTCVDVDFLFVTKNEWQ